MTSKKLAEALPPLPPSLRSISSYMQRAEELRTKDPVMAYWCTYYAAQLGLDLKSHEAGARDYLYALITLLEGMKKDLEGNDAVEHEAAGAAYVENFAVKVFALADNEDRRGETSRSTAKKFLAAANFLELLRVFEKSNNAEVNEDKVRYAKWKASDIAKAFREGRKPTPGAARKEVEGTVDIPANSANMPTAVIPPDRSPGGGMSVDLSPGTGSLHVQYPTPPSTLKGSGPPGSTIPVLDDATEFGNWSTVATPGSQAAAPWLMSTPGEQDDHRIQEQEIADPDTCARRAHFASSMVGGLSTTDESSTPSPDLRRSGLIDSSYHVNNAAGMGAQNVVPSGVPPSANLDPTVAPLPDSSPSASSHASLEGTPPKASNKPIAQLRPESVDQVAESTISSGDGYGSSRSSPPSFGQLSLQPSASSSPPSVPPIYSGARERRASISKRDAQPGPVDLHPYPAQPPSQAPSNASFVPTTTFISPIVSRINGSPHASVSGLPSIISNQPVSSPYGTSYALKQPSPPTRYASVAQDASPAVELTSALIAKAQKHCRYAISALEYEDAEQARKELRAALALLGD